MTSILRKILPFLLLVLYNLHLSYCFAKHYIIAREDGTNNFYLLKNGRKHRLPDNDTVTAHTGLNPGDFNKIDVVSKAVLAQFLNGKELSSLKRGDSSPDDIMRLELLKIESLQLNHENLLEDSFVQLPCTNVPVVVWHGAGLVLCHTQYNMHMLAWLDATFRNLDNNRNELGIAPVPATKEQIVSPVGEINNLPLLEDARMIVFPDSKRNEDKILLSFTQFMPSIKRNRIGMAQITLSQPDNKAHLSNLVVYHFIDKSAWDNQKNWIPFSYNKSIYFIQHIDTMSVIKFNESLLGSNLYNTTVINNNSGLDETNIKYFSQVKIEFQVPKIQLAWEYGDIRGGTPAHLVSKHEYLAFFHSNIKLKGNARWTYFMGCFMFTSHPPF